MHLSKKARQIIIQQVATTSAQLQIHMARYLNTVKVVVLGFLALHLEIR